MRAVVSKRIAGLGSCLVSLFCAWFFAQRTNRCLVIDWRNSMYLPDPGTNLFDVLFENRSTISNVPIVTGDNVKNFQFEEPFYPAGWNLHNIHVIPDKYRNPVELDAAYPEIRFGRCEQNELSLRGCDVMAPTVVFHHGLRDEIDVKDRTFSNFPSQDILETFLNDLIESSIISDLVNDFTATHFRQRPVVGLHIRHGNGETSRLPDRLNNDPRKLLKKCGAALGEFRRTNGQPDTVFLCTDSIEVLDYFKDRLPNLVTFPKKMPPRGTGAMHTGTRDSNLAITALTEMLLLSRCDALIHTESQFTFYPLFKTRFGWSASLNQAG